MFNKKTFSKILNAWYRKNSRDLPWRKNSDPYKIWVSEIMLQQTTVSTVIPYFNRWIKEFPTVKYVANAPIDQLLNQWQGLGYYQRVRNMQKSAQIIVDKYKSQVPNNAEKLSALPGFGPYTTGAVLSIAFDKRVPIIDTNVKRVVMRILNIDEEKEKFTKVDIYSFLDQVMPKSNNRTFNQAMMELGALICSSNNPNCVICPLVKQCKAYDHGTQELIPLKKKKVITNIKVVIALIKNGSQYYIQKRPSKGLWADFWEFPGGKVEEGESLQSALKREIKEECNVKIEFLKIFAKVHHFYTQYRVALHAYHCEIDGDLLVDDTHKWVKVKELERYPMPSGNAKILSMLLVK